MGPSPHPYPSTGLPGPAELARIEEGRQALGISEIAGESEAIAGGSMSFTAPGSWSNLAVGLGFDGPVTGGDLDRLVEFYRARNCSAQIEVAPYAHPSLMQGLSSRGFTTTGSEQVFAMALGGRPLHPSPRPGGLTLATLDVGDPTALEQWIEVSTSGFRPAGVPMQAHHHDITRRLALHPRTTCHVARIGGEVVGASTMESWNDMGALFGTSVLPAHRRRGVQLALMLERLEALKSRGLRFATVGSRPGISTEKNALQLGFSLAYTKVCLGEKQPPGA